MQPCAAIALTCALLAAPQPATAQNFEMTNEQFDAWVYNGMGQRVDDDSQVALKIAALDRTCHLTDSQKQKLQLAAQGDFARFKRELEELRTELVGKSYDQQAMNTLWQKIQPFQQRYQAGLLGEKSFYSKVSHTLLTAEQREQQQAAEQERLKAHHRARVKLFVAMLEQQCPLTAKQRDAFLDVLLKETKPAKKASQYDSYVVMAQIPRISDDKLKPILDERQLKMLKKSIDQMRGMENHLRQIGVLPD